MEWFVLALLSAFFAAVAAIFAKIGLEGLDSNVATALRTIVMTAFIFTFVLSIGKGRQLTELRSREAIFIISSGIAGALSWLLYFGALKVADASRVAPIDRASVLFVVILSALLLGEKITLKTAVATLLIFIGVVLLALKLD